MTKTISQLDTLPDSAYLRQSNLIRQAKNITSTGLLPFSAATLWRKVKDGTFPPPIKLSQRVTVWRMGDVREWLQNCNQE